MKVMKTMRCRLWEHNDKASRRNYKTLCTQSRNAKEDASPANRSARRVCSRPLLLRLRLLLVLLLLRLRLRAHQPCDDPPSPRRARDEPTSATEGLAYFDLVDGNSTKITSAHAFVEVLMAIGALDVRGALRC